MRSRWYNLLVLLSLILGLVPVTAAQAAPISELPAIVQAAPNVQENTPAEIERALLDKLSTDGVANFVIVMAEQADLSKAYEIEDWVERGQYVYDALRATASRTQASVVGYALQRNLSYESFFSVNTIHIKMGDLQAAQDIAGLPGVALVREPKVAHINPDARIEGPAPLAPTAYGWNLDVLDPDSNLYGMQAAQVWDQYGIRGEGVVVANIDTGVTYQHEALDRQYRGNLGSSYDHDFSWYAPTTDAQLQCGGDAATSPCDSDGHGSGTAGIMVGETADLTEQNGAAPGAKWIACMGCDGYGPGGPGGCSEAALTGCADWYVAPCPIGVDPGDPSCDPSQRPHIINNSWGGGSNDPWYRGYVQAWVAAGMFPAFSAGNAYACAATGSPGDNPESFGTAAHGSNGQNVYAGGPSWFTDPSCDPEAHEIDPHINAPTFGRAPSNIPGAYYSLSGTSGASPHTAGAVALIWATNPALVGEVNTTFTILEQSADRTSTQTWREGDCGKPACAGSNPYPNYEYGWGYLDVLAAVEEAQLFGGGIGYIDGQVTDANSGNPIQDATIMATLDEQDKSWQTLSDASGMYDLTVFSGTYTLDAFKYGYAPEQFTNLSVVSGTTTTQNIALTPAAYYEVSGQVTDATTGWPLYAQINVTGDPIGPLPPDNSVWTDPETGAYSIMLAEGVTYTFDVEAWVAGYSPAMGEVGPLTADAPNTDFALDADAIVCVAPGYEPVFGYREDFEANDGGYTHSGTPDDWEWGMPTVWPNACASGDACWGTNLDGNYANSANETLLSPVIDLTGLPLSLDLSVTWQQAWHIESASWDHAYAEVSINGGPWQEMWSHVAGTVQVGWTEMGYDIADAAGGTVQFRWRFTSDSSVVYSGYYIDDVFIQIDCSAPTDGGLVVGNVYDANYPTMALDGAEVVNDAGEMGMTADGGFYTLFSPSGNHVFTATMEGGYAADVETVAAVTGDTVRQDFALPAGLLSATPAGVAATVQLGYVATQTLSLENTGAVDAMFSFIEAPGGFIPLGMTLQQLVEASTVVWDEEKLAGECAIYKDSIFAEPAEALDCYASVPKPRVFNTPSPLAPTDMGYAQDIGYISDNFVSFPLNDFPGQTVVGTSTNAYYGMDFDPAAEVLYALNDTTDELGTIDLTNGAFTALAPCASPSGSWTGLTIDPVTGDFYASDATNLYMIDPDTGANTLIGPFGGGVTLMIDIAMNMDGELYGHDIATDSIYQVNPATGAATVIGATGYNANYAQGMDFDNEDGTLYIFLYQGSGANVFGIVDLTTGAVTPLAVDNPLGEFEGAIQTGAGGGVPWLSEEPVEGSVAASDAETIEVTFDAAYVDQPGEYHADLIVKHDTPYDTFNIPVTMTVEAPNSWGKIEGTVTGLGVCDADPMLLEEAEVHIESATTGEMWVLTTDISGTYALWLDEGHSPVTVTVMAPDYHEVVGAVVIEQGQTTTLDFTMRALLPCLSYAPAGLEATLAMGDNELQILDLYNTGAALATFELTELGGDFWPAAPAPVPMSLVTIGDPIGDNALTTSSAPEVSDAPQSWALPEVPDAAYFLTHSLSQDIIQFNSVSCSAGGLHTDNSYMRVFYLPDFGIMNPFEITEVEMGIETAVGAGGNQPVEVRLYTLDGALLWANMTLIGQASVNIPDQDLTHFTIPVSGNAPAGSTLVVEFFTPNGQTAGHSLYVGSNNLGQTALSYLAAADCGITEPTDTGTIGFPDMHIVMNVTGVTAGVGGVPWLFEDPISGTIPADSIMPVDITFDAGVPETMQPGEYHATLQVTSDAPNAVPGIPVTLTVTAPDSWGKVTGTVTGLGYCDTMTPTLLEDAEVTIESGTGMVSWMLTTDENGEYAFWLDAAHSPVTITVAYPDHVAEVIPGVVVTAGDTTTQNVALRWAMPCLTVDPDMFDVSVTLGMSTTVPFSLTNWGAAGTGFDLVEANGGFTIMAPFALPTTIPTIVGVSNPAWAEVGASVGEPLIGAPAGGAAPEAIGPAWETMASMPSARVFNAVVADTNGYVYVIGGTSDAGGATSTNTTFRYNTATDSWDTMATMPVALNSIDGAVINGKIYIPGDATTANTFVYDIATNAWSTLATSGAYSARSQYQVVAIGTDLYVLGGIVAAANASTTEVWVLNTTTGVWTTGVPMQKSRTSFSAGAIDGDIYVAGGVLFPGFTPDMTAEKFDGTSWSYIATLPDGGGAYTRWSYNADGVGTDGLWLGAGRRDAGWAVLNHAGYYNPDTDTWTDSPTIPTLAQGRVYMEGDVASDGYFYVIGGRDSAGATTYATNERLEVGYAGGGVAGGDIPWLSEDPETGMVAADSTVVVDLTFDASDAVTEVTQPGEYFGTLYVTSDDPYNGNIPVPVTMTVEPPATWGKVMGTVQSLGYCDADPSFVEGANVLIEGSSGMTWTLTTDADGMYAIWLDASESTITVTVEAPDHEKGEATGVVVSAGGTTTQDFDLRWLVPCVEADPLGLHAMLELGATATEVLTLTNTGAVDSDWNIAEENLGDPTGTLPGVAPLFSEDFEGATFPPAGWAVVENIGSCQWESSATTGNANQTGGSGQFADADSDGCGTGMDTELWTPSFDLSAASAPALSFHSDFNDYGSTDDGYVDISTDGGATWTNLLHYDGVDVRGPRLVEIDLSAYAGQPNVLIRFHYVAPGWDWWWQVDDVQVSDIDQVIWLSETPASGTLVADTGEQVVDVGFDASQVDQPGEYYANAWINSDDPTAPIILPVTMTVSVPATWAVLDGTVYSTGYCDAEMNPVEGAEVTIENGISALLTTDANGAYSYWLAPGTYTVTASAADHTSVVEVVTITTAVSQTQDFSLTWLVPCVSVEPESIEDTLEMGTSSTHFMTITNMGAGDATFTLVEYGELLTLSEPWEPEAQQPLQLVTVGDNVLGNNPNPPQAPTGAAPSAPIPSPHGVVLLTHSLSQQVLSGNSVSCNAGGLHADNSYVRVFDLAAFGITDYFDVQSVDVGIETAAGSGGIQPATVNLYTLDGPLAWANMTLIGSAAVDVTDQNLTIITVPVTGTAPAGAVLVVEFFTPDGQAAGHSLYVGSNDLGQTGPTYLAAATCGIVEPTSTAVIGFPDMHLVMNVTGFTPEPVDVPWLSEDPVSGMVMTGNTEGVTVTLDANYVPAPGVYYATIGVATDDPEMPSQYVSVIMTATLPATYGQITGTVMGLGPCDDPLTAMPLEGAEVLVESAAISWTVMTDADGLYSLWLDEMYSPVTITVTALDYVSDAVSGVTVISGTTTMQDFMLRPEAPCFGGVMPADAHVTLAMGMSTTVPVTVVNTGAGALDWSVSETDDGFAILSPMAAGGPDAFGYTFMDSDESGGPVYDWVDIAASGSAVYLGDDDWDGPFPIGFTFNFYGNDYTEFYIGSNGFISFGAGSTALTNQNLPSTSTPNNLIALMWDDLDPGDTSDPAYYQAFTSCPYGGGACLVVQYDDFCHFPGGASCNSAGTWEAVLFENGSILIQFEDVGVEVGSSATTGIENSTGTDGLTYVYNSAIMADASAVCFAYPGQAPNCTGGVPWLDEDPTSGTVAPEATAPVTLTFDAGVPEVTQPGDYYATLTFEADGGAVEMPVTMTVEAPATWGKLEGLVQGLGYCDVMTEPIDGAVVFIESTVTTDTWALGTDAAGLYALWLDEMYSPLTVTISYEAGYDAQVFTDVAIISGTVTTVDADLLWLQPCITVAPDALEFSVPMGTSTTVGLNLANMGAFTGSFLLHEWSLGFEILGPSATGGPDSFGYEFADSNTVGISPVYDFVDISDVGTPVALGDNDNAAVAIGFDFKFYGNSAVDPNLYDTVFVGSNGFLSFGAGSNDISPDPVLPDPTLPNNLIAAAWDDLVPGDVYVQSFPQCPYNPAGTTMDACFIVQYDDFTHAGGSPAGTWQVILFRSGSILMQYAEVDAPDATTGIEGPLGLDGLTYGPALADELAICFAYPGEWLDCQSTEVPWLHTDVDEGDIAAYDNLTIDVTLDASVPEVSEPGDYLAELWITSNDPVNPLHIIPVTMTVEMPATMGKMWGTVYAWGYCDAVSTTMAGAQIMIEDGAGDAWMMYTDADGNYGMWLPEGEVVTMTVMADGYVAETMVDTVVSGVMPAHDVELHADMPCIQSDAAEYNVILVQGESTTRMLTLHNAGAGELVYTNDYATGLWLSVASGPGVIAPYSSQEVPLFFDSTGLDVGVYNSNMEILHNDPEAGRLFVRPIQMTVVAEGTILLPMIDAKEGYAGETVTYAMTVTNLADTAVTFDVMATGNAWTTTVPMTVTVAAGAMATFAVDVDIPLSAQVGMTDTVTITVESQGADGQTGVALLQTTVIEQPIQYIYLPLVLRNAQ